MSQITNVLQQSCLDNPQNNLRVWSVLHPLLKQLEDLHAPALAFERPESPKCPQKPVSTVRHGEEWHDSYSWLTDRNDPEVLEYIQSENSYSQKLMNATKPIQDLLYCEFLSRLDQTAESSKVQKPDGFSYYQRKVPGQEYPVNCRVDKNGVEHVYLDENELANSKEFEDASFFKVAAVKLSPDCKIVAYGVDLTGQERYTVFFKRLADLKVLPDSIPNVDKDFEFSNDCKSVYYSLLDSQERAFQVKRHLLGADCASDTVMFHEEDEMFYVTLSKTDNNEYIILKSSAQVTNESHYITAKTCDSTPQMIIPRRENIHYTCKHHGNHFYILTNEGGKNNWIFRVPVSDVGSIKNYNDLVKIRSKVIEHRDFVLIEGA
jgi:oligopeptidase B